MSARLTAPYAAVVDYGMGNLFSVQRACEHAGLPARITASAPEILAASAVILPGIGAFPDAMSTLHRLDLAAVLRDVAASDTPLLGVCLGMQLLMSESAEFGRHEGLEIIPGAVVPFDAPVAGGRRLKVPQVCWNRLRWASTPDGSGGWAGTLLDGLPDGVFMYFVHSYYVKPADASVVVATTDYGDVTFCSALRVRNIFAFQGHPERSGPRGLKVYENLAAMVNARYGETPQW